MAGTRHQYAPDYAVSTEQVLKGYLEDMGLSTHDLALKCDYSTEAVGKILRGEKRIDQEFANRLESALGLKAYLWLGIEEKYQNWIERQALDGKNEQSPSGQIADAAEVNPI